jgi:hypothetical protein
MINQEPVLVLSMVVLYQDRKAFSMAPIPTAATDTDAHETARRRLTQSMIEICGQRPCARLVCTLELQSMCLSNVLLLT